jgi:hypothetical protein
VEDVLPLPKTNLFKVENASKAKKKKKLTIPKKYEFDPIYVELDLES